MSLAAYRLHAAYGVELCLTGLIRAVVRVCTLV
jgi:hypothetical protein